MRRSKGLRLEVLAVTATVMAWACVEVDPGDQSTVPGDEELLRDLLASVADNAIDRSYSDFATTAAGLEAATAAYADALENGDEDVEELREAAQGAWRDAIAAWQIAEVMQLGPAGNSSDAIGGADLRDEIYSWPGVNDCRIDQEIVAGEFGELDFVETRLVNAYGLDAVEYLLFYSGTENSCSPQLPINLEGQWDALGQDEIDRRRAAYAASISAAIAETGTTLAADWAAGSGDYNTWLSDPTAADSPYGSIKTAMDELLRAMFYVDIWVKDAKIGAPAGLMDCNAPTCLEALESRQAHVSKEHVVANLRGLQRIYLGGLDPEEGTGFDDLLISLDEVDLAHSIASEIASAIEEVEGIEGSFADALTQDEGALDECHTAVKRVTDLLKGDFATVLTLQIPSDAAGDAD